MHKDPLSNLNDPKMLTLLKDINKLKEELKNNTNEEETKTLKKRIADLQMHYNILSERRGSY